MIDIENNVISILNFLGFEYNELITKQEYEVLKSNVKNMYLMVYNEEYSDNDFEKLFKVKYLLKNSNTKVAVKRNNSTIQQTFKIKDDELVPNYMHMSEEETISNLTNGLIDAYVVNDETMILSDLSTVEQRDEHYEKMMNEMKLKIKGILKKKTNHYDFLRNLPQPVQKSKEWFELRDGMITASAAAEILGESKYGTRTKALLDKVGILPNKYQENMFVYHGKKYELIATMIYEHLFNTKVGEFGLVPYQNDESDLININFMGASPDGISTCVTLDGKPNPLVGRMLEIKCPLKRKIETKGEIDGGICPHYYWVQVQMQLACCKNDDCDFWQCNIQEYDEDDWLLDNTEDQKIECISTVEQNVKLPINSKLTKGCVIQLMPKDKSKVPKGDRWAWYAKYIYPSNLMMNDDEYIDWIKYIESNWKTLYPQYVTDYYYDKPLYWKLRSCHNVLIKRDVEWFRSKIPAFQEFWQEVQMLRKNEQKAQKILDDYLKKETKETKYKKPIVDTTSDQMLSSEENKPNIKLSNDTTKTTKTNKTSKTTKVKTNTDTKLTNDELKKVFLKTKKSKLLDDEDDFLSSTN